MKRTLRICLATLTMFLFASSVWAQGGIRAIYYCPDDGLHPLGEGCNEATRVPFADGWSYCIFWDNNANGPDDLDEVVPIGTNPGYCVQSCWGFNGLSEGCGEGFFYTSPLFNMASLPISPDTALYYVRLSGANCCWTSTVFTVEQGFNQDLYLTYEDWTCDDEPCCTGFVVPDPPTNVQASDDAYCLHVEVTWEHSGENVTGFTVYADGDAVTTTGATARSAPIDICMDGAIDITVAAVNGCETSELVSDQASTYLRRFLPGIGGSYSGGSDIDIHLSRPPLEGSCPAYMWFDLFSNNTYVARLCSLVNPEQPLVLDLTCQLPAQDLTNCYIVMSDTNPSLQCGTSDTTDVFNITVDAETDPGVVREFSLGQNYPNPFNPETRIEFSVPSNSDVVLSVFDLNGRLVNTLVSSTLPAGKHVATWNGRSASGAPVAAGLYFYQIRAGNHVETKKMLFLK